MRLLLPIMILLLAAPLRAEESFIDGFPDVPLLSGVRGIDGESVFFDTPSGTIAEVKLLVEGGGDKLMADYAEALAGLGWACTKSPQALRCEREENRLIFFDPDPRVKNGTVILRLEPKG